MAMNKNVLKDLILSKMDPSPETAEEAHDNWCEALKEFLEEHCEVTCSWVATNPSGDPDPVTSFSAKPVYNVIEILPPANFDAWLVALSDSIQTGIITPDDSSFVFPTPLLFFDKPIVSVPSGLSDPEEAIVFVCNDIVNSVKSMIGKTSSGVHGSYTGIATVITIL